VFKRDREVTWKCRNCGYTVKALEAPQECPACEHPQGWFEVQEVLEETHDEAFCQMSSESFNAQRRKPPQLGFILSELNDISGLSMFIA
jgi:ABC-type ATPase with predicted acetyltransferase domain